MKLITMGEYLRQKLVAEAEKRGSLNDPEVLRISQQLDKILFRIQMEMQRPSTRTAEHISDHMMQ